MALRINLLPPQQKRELLFEKRTRLAYFLSGSVLAVFLVFAVLLLPSFIMIYFQKNGIQNQLKVERALSETKRVQALEDKINQITESISLLEKIQLRSKPLSPILASLSENLVLGVSLLDFSFRSENNEINIRGYALDRDSFLAFKENIEKDENFKDIISPLSNIIKEKDIEFTLTFYLKQ